MLSKANKPNEEIKDAKQTNDNKKQPSDLHQHQPGDLLVRNQPEKKRHTPAIEWWSATVIMRSHPTPFCI